MTDRELLERAAKAAGHIVEGETASGLWVNDGSSYLEPWDPLGDDSDALRLAVKLSLLIDVGRYAETTEVHGLSLAPVQEPHNGDPYAATRRAIVRAAAAMAEGKA